MKIITSSLRNRIFFSMMLLTLIASVLIAGISMFQFREQTKDYHEKRLLRKENTIKKNIAYVLRQTSYEVSTEKLPLIFKEEIYEISNMHGMAVQLYDLNGKLIKTSKADFIADTVRQSLPISILKGLKNASNSRYVEKFEQNNQNYRSSYTYLNDHKFKHIGILHLPYLENDDFMKHELEEFLIRLSLVYLIMFCLSIVIGYLLSRYITQSISNISERLKGIDFAQQNAKLPINTQDSEEINTLVRSYNNMVDQLEESAVKLAKSEREQAWREMAKQVAHEIKNPLTPMRLTVQSFERRFDPQDEDIRTKLKEYSNSLLEQIDVMSQIASAFSAYASMPKQKNETIDLGEVTASALDIFDQKQLQYNQPESSHYTVFERTQWVRVITNLVKNALQAEADNRDIQINVTVEKQDQHAVIVIADNGTGIREDYIEKIFEPKFTTKNSGMGLGLAMVKQLIESYGGTITLTSTLGEGTTFRIHLPLIQPA